MSERVDRHMHLRSPRALVTVIAGAGAALDARSRRERVEHGRRRLGVPALGQPEQNAEVVDDRLEAAGGQPTPDLLVDYLSGREVARQVSPGSAADDPAEGVEYVAEAVDALAGVLGVQRQVIRDERPLHVGDVGRMGFANSHTLNYGQQPTKINNTI